MSLFIEFLKKNIFNLILISISIYLFLGFTVISGAGTKMGGNILATFLLIIGLIGIYGNEKYKKKK